MERDKHIAASQNNGEYRRARHKRTGILVVAAVALVGFFLFSALFLSSYRRLSASIQQERTDYVSEISSQILTSRQFMKNEYSNDVRNYANVVNSGDIKTLSALRAYFQDREGIELLLIDANGGIVDLHGQAVFLSDRTLIEILHSGQEAHIFTSLNNAEDYWIFSVPLNARALGDAEYVAIALAVSADEFRDSLAISLFDNRGASYIIDINGGIAIKPAEEKATFGGYNLFSSMRQAGAAEDDIAALREEIAGTMAGSRMIRIRREQWLVSYSALDEQREVIVVMVPLTITAAQTYDGLTDTIAFAVLAVGAISLFAMLLIWFFVQRDRARSREAMAVAAKSDFFSKMGHDIRTPLNAIVGMEMLARDNLNDTALAADYLDKSSSAANYLLGILNDVLDMSRIESGKLVIAHVPFDMNALLEDVRSIITPTALQKSLRFEVTADAAFATAYLGDQVRVKQILMNLLSNAVKFTKPGGSVALEVAHAAIADGRDEVTLVVRDTGIGISENYLSRIFTPFEQERTSYTEQYAGSGLGLSIVHNLVDLMGGSLAVQSKVGEGTAFTVRLSFARGEEIDRTEKASDSPPVSYQGRRVLLAEDNAVNQQVAVAILTRKFGMQVDVAADGKQAVERFGAAPAGFYDLVLMDVKMPVMDGLDAARRIRVLTHPDARTVPILALSANAFAEDTALSISAGMNDHLAKPINIQALASALEKYLNR